MITSTFNSNLRSKPDPTLALILNRAPALGQTLPLAVSPYRVRPNSGRNQQADGSWAWCDDDRMDLLTLEEVHGYSFRYKVKLYMLKHGYVSKQYPCWSNVSLCPRDVVSALIILNAAIITYLMMLGMGHSARGKGWVMPPRPEKGC